MEYDLDKILAERFNTNELINLARDNDKLIKDLIRISISDNPITNWRAAWILAKVIEKNDKQVKKSIPQILKVLRKCEDGHQRELLKIVKKIDISESHEGQLFDICLTIWEDISKIPSVRITAFKSLLNIAKKYPELKNEIYHFTEEIYLENLSPGIKRSFQKLVEK